MGKKKGEPKDFPKIFQRKEKSKEEIILSRQEEGN